MCKKNHQSKPINTELQETHKQLERMVELRTEQLRLANLQLEKQMIEREKVEAERKRTIDRLQTILETVAEGITFGDETGQFEVFNSKMEEITGYTKKEANACEDFLALLYPDPGEYQKAMTELEILSNSGVNSHRETKIRTKSGAEKILLVSSSLLKDGARNLFLSAYRDITQRQAAEKALAESEARKKALLSGIPDALFCVDREGMFWEFIPAKNFDPLVPMSQFLGKKIKDVLPEPIATLLTNLVVKTLETKTTQNLEYQLPIKNEIRDYEVRMAIFMENQVLAIVRDISDRKQAERDVQKHMQWNQLILDRTMDGFLRFDYQGNILDVNAAFAKIVQYSRDELIKMNIQNLLHQDKSEIFDKTYQNILAFTVENYSNNIDQFYQKSHRFKTKYRRGDGQVIYVEISVTMTELEDQPLLFAFVRDISDRVVTAQALFESQRLIQKVTDTVPVIIYIYDLVTHKNIYFNSQICEILGYSIAQIQEMENKQNLLQNLLHPDDRRSAKQLEQRWHSVKDGEIIQTEMRMKTATGDWRSFQCEETLFLRNSENLPKQILGVAVDITERKKTQEKLLRLSKGVNSTSDAISMTDRHGIVIYINPAFVKLFGYQIPQIIGKKGLDILYTDSSVNAVVFKAIQQGESWIGEVKMQTRFGREY
jgi:PAS domain S-box-containing protein